MTNKLRNKSKSQISVLVYQGGRCGEFLHSLLSHHINVTPSVSEVSPYDWDPTLNRYKTHDRRNPRLFNKWAFEKKKPTIQDFKLDPEKDHLLRSHCVIPFQDIFGPDCKVIIVYSENYNNTYSTLYWLKHLLQPQLSLGGNITAWEHIVKSTGENIKTAAGFLKSTLTNNLNDAENNLYNPQPMLAYAKKTYNPNQCFYLNIDDLFVNDDFSTYVKLCEFLGLEYIDSVRSDLKSYHKKNVELLQQYGIKFEKDCDNFFSQIESNVSKIIQRLDAVKPNVNSQPKIHTSISLAPLTVIQYTAGRGGEFLSSYLSQHTGYTPIETKTNDQYNYYRAQDPLRGFLNPVNRKNINWDMLINGYFYMDKQPRITTTYYSDNNHIELAGWFKTHFVDRGAKIILPISIKHDAFFTALAFIKYWFVRLNDDAWKKFLDLESSLKIGPHEFYQILGDDLKLGGIPIWKIYSLAYFEEVLPLSDWYDRTGITVKEKQYMRIMSRLNRTAVLDLDRLYFNKDYSVYYDLCKFLNTEPRDDYQQVFEEYHNKNLALVKNLDLTLTNEEVFKNWVLKYEQTTK